MAVTTNWSGVKSRFNQEADDAFLAEIRAHLGPGRNLAALADGLGVGRPRI